MSLQSIQGAAPAKGPYSPAIRAGNLLFVKPASAIVPVAAFPGGFKVEVDAVAVLD